MKALTMSCKKGTFEDYLGVRGLKRLGKKRWRKHVDYWVARLISALHLDEVVLGGGNARKLNELPKGCRVGDNVNAFLGGFRLWAKADEARRRRAQARTRPAAREVGRRQAPAAKPGTKPASVPAAATPPGTPKVPVVKSKTPTI